MRVSIIGSGYVGTTVAACFAELGHEVVNVDIDETITAGDAQHATHRSGCDGVDE